MPAKVAAIQMNSGADVTANLAQAKLLIQQAVAAGAELIVLPEMFPIRGQHDADKLAVKEIIGSGPIQKFLMQQAQEHKIWLVGGTIPIMSEEADKIYAAALVYDAQGKQVARYDKIHMFDVFVGEQTYQESATIISGKTPLILDTPFGRLALAVCYDIRFPDFTSYLARHNAEIVAVPTAFTAVTGKAHWDILIRNLALQTQAFVVAACEVGSHPNGRVTYGHSVIVDPWGSKLAEQIADIPASITAELDFNILQKVRNNMPLHLQRKLMPAD